MTTPKKSPELATIAEEKVKDTVKKAVEEAQAIASVEKAEVVVEKAVAAAQESAQAAAEAIEATETAATNEVEEADDIRKLAGEVSFAAKRTKEDALSSSAAAKAAEIAALAARMQDPNK